MNGPEHYRAAEKHLESALGADEPDETAHLRYAQVHATLALAAATALRVTTVQFGDSDQLTEWQNIHHQKGSPE